MVCYCSRGVAGEGGEVRHCCNKIFTLEYEAKDGWHFVTYLANGTKTPACFINREDAEAVKITETKDKTATGKLRVTEWVGTGEFN